MLPDMERGSTSESVGESRSLNRALDAMEMLARAGRPLGLGELTEGLEATKPSVHRALRTLQARGYVSQDAVSGRYGLGIRCFELSSLWAQGLDVRVVARPHLRALNEAVGETVHLGVYEQGEVVYVEKLDSPRPVIAVSFVGRRYPSTVVSTGRALLAYQRSEEIDRVLSAPPQSYTSHTVTDPAALREVLAAVRRDGYATNVSGLREGVCGVAAPIRDHTGLVVASVGCCMPDVRFDEERRPILQRATLDAARAISHELGWVETAGTGSAGGREAPPAKAASAA